MPAYSFGHYVIEAEERRLADRDGHQIDLTPKVFDTLLLLVEAGGRLVTREEFQARIWGATVVEERNLTVNISTLRKALNREGEDYIETVPRAGYRLSMPVQIINTPAPDPVPAPLITASTPSVQRWTIQPAFAIAVLVLIAATLAGLYVARREPESSMPGQGPLTLAVLPFSIVGTPADDARLGLGLADAVITRLGQLPELTVRPTSAIKQYGSGGNLVAIGEQLGVGHVVEGVVRAEANQVRVAVKIVDVDNGAVRWQETFDRPYHDLFELQEAVSAGVASSLVKRFAAERSWGQPARPAASDEAYRAYLDGKALMQGNVDLDVSGAMTAFQRSVALDPTFAPAWAGLARAYRSRGYSLGGDPHAFGMRAREAAQRAIELDPDLSEAHTVLGILHFSYDWDWQAAERELRRAVELAPRSHDAQQWLGYALYSLGRYQEGLEILQRAALINPMEPKTQIAEALWFTGRVDEALGMLEETTRLNPSQERPQWLRVFILDQAGRYEEAVQARRAAANAIGDTAYLRELDQSVAQGPRAVLEQDLRMRQARKNLGDVAWLQVQLGHPELALDALEACADQLCNAVPLLRTDARFRSLSGEPRFAALLHRLHLDSLDATETQ